MEKIELQDNETVVTGRKFKRLDNTESKNWNRISGWSNIIDVLDEELITASEIVKGKIFANCKYKGRVVEFRKSNMPFHKGIPLREDN